MCHRLIHMLTLAICGGAAAISNTTVWWPQPGAYKSDVVQQTAEIVQQVVQGPARGRGLAIYLDSTLAPVTQNMILKLLPPPKLPLLHLAVVLTPQTSLTPELSTAPPPRNLLLVCLGFSLHTESQLIQSLHTVYSLALLFPLPNEPRSLATYSFRPFCSPKLHFLGRWSASTFPTWVSLFPDRFPTTCPATFHLASWFADPPFLYRRRSNNQRAGISYAMLRVLAHKLNFSYTMTEKSEDGKWGNIENGEWTGVLGMVVRGEKEFSVNGFLMADYRLEAMDVSEPLWYEPISMFLRTPFPLPKWQSLIRPFTYGVWMAVLLAFLMCLCCTLLQQRVRRRGRDPCLVLLSALLCQSAPYIPEPRPLVSLWLLMCLVITSAFTSNLMSIYTTPAFPARITTLPQLAASDIRLAAKDHGSAEPEMLRESKVLRPFRTRIDLYKETEEIVAKMMAGTHGFVGSASYTSVIISEFKVTNYYQMREPFLTSRLAWFFGKYTPWKDKIDKNIKRLMEAGIINHFYKTELESLGIRGSGRGEGGHGRAGEGQDGAAAGRSLTISHLQGLFWLLGLAWAVCTSVFLVEIIPRIHRGSCF